MFSTLLWLVFAAAPGLNRDIPPAHVDRLTYLRAFWRTAGYDPKQMVELPDESNLPEVDALKSSKVCITTLQPCHVYRIEERFAGPSVDYCVFRGLLVPIYADRYLNALYDPMWDDAPQLPHRYGEVLVWRGFSVGGAEVQAATARGALQQLLDR
jgi:hypothetical protein